MSAKIFKDPIYGYIEVEEEYLGYVDSILFQRLRNIRQTGYASLYPTSSHTRFEHSLGVFHLGKLSLNAVKPNITSEIRGAPKVNPETIGTMFLAACLLHDVGHAPFSHTGENYYLQDDNGANDPKSPDPLTLALIEEIDSPSFTKDVLGKSLEERAQAHELMSALISAREFKEKLGQYREFLVRCIIGYQYGEADGAVSQIYNVLISLLHGKHIDIDRLDYNIRDSAMTGYQGMMLDYIRLLSGLRILPYNGEGLKLVYNKSSLSVIQNALYANHLEKHWIQVHPVIKYEEDIIKYAIEQLSRQYRRDWNSKLFSYDSVVTALPNPQAGILSGEDKERLLPRAFLLGDEYVLFGMKNICPNIEDCDGAYINEYFNRAERRKAIWKSHAEFKAYFSAKNRESRSKLTDVMSSLETVLTEDCRLPPKVDKDSRNTILSVQTDLEKKTDFLALPAKEQKTQLAKFKFALQAVEILETICTEDNLEFDFVVIGAKDPGDTPFEMANLDASKTELLIEFAPQMILPLRDVAPPLKPSEEDCPRFFYLYHKDPIEASAFTKKLIARCDTISEGDT